MSVDRFRNLEPGIWDLGSGIWDLGSGIWDLGSGIWDLGSGIWDLGSEIRNLESVNSTNRRVRRPAWNRMHRRYRPIPMKKLLILVVLGVVTASCASSPASSETETTTTMVPAETTATSPTSTTVPPAPVLVFTVREDGGCMMAGPNCAEYQFYDDGTVDIFRVGTRDHHHRKPRARSMSHSSPRCRDALDGADLASIYESLAPGGMSGRYDASTRHSSMTYQGL